MIAPRWSLDLPHKARLPDEEGGAWLLAVSHDHAKGWTWTIGHTHKTYSRLGHASSAGLAIRCAEDHVAKL